MSAGGAIKGRYILIVFLLVGKRPGRGRRFASVLWKTLGARGVRKEG